MTACNARPPAGHPFHGTPVACHLDADHVTAGYPHSWDIDAAVARHAIVARALDELRVMFPGREIAQFDAQLPHPLMAYVADPHTGERAEHPYRSWKLPGGPWLVVRYLDGEEFAIWKVTGDVYRVGPDGAVGEHPIIEGTAT